MTDTITTEATEAQDTVASEPVQDEATEAQDTEATEAEAEAEEQRRSYNRWTPNSNSGVQMDEVANMRQRFVELANALNRVSQTYDKHGEDPDTLERLLRQYGEPKPGTGWVGRTIAKITVLKPLLPDNGEGKSLRSMADKRIAAARRAMAERAAEYAAEVADVDGEEQPAE